MAVNFVTYELIRLAALSTGELRTELS